MKAEELDRKFDKGEDVLEFFDLSTLRRPGLENKPVNGVLPIGASRRSRDPKATHEVNCPLASHNKLKNDADRGSHNQAQG